MNKKIGIIIFSIIIIILSSTLIIINTNKKETIVRETVNLDDGLQVEELENLNEDDYKKLNSPDIYNLGLDEVDNNYYYKMIEMPGVYKANATREEREKINLYNNDLKAAALDMCKKNGDWSLIINNNRYGEYNQKDGLLKDFKYNTLESGDWIGDDYSGYVDIIARNDKEERKYRISIYTEDGIISDINVKLGEVKSLKRNEEKDLNKLKFDKEHTKDNFINLGMYEEAYRGGLDWYGEDIGITDNFYEKYPYFLDIFIHYSPLEYNKVTLKDLDIEKQIAIFEVDSILECKKRTYDVKYILDNKMYLEDVEVKLLKEEVVDLGKPEKQAAYWIYKNSDWSKLKLSSNFLNKYNSKDGVFVDLDIVSFNNASIVQNREYIYQFRTNSNDTYYYYLIKTNNSKNEIDNITYEKLPYDSSMTLEEVRNAYIRDYVEKK